MAGSRAKYSVAHLSESTVVARGIKGLEVAVPHTPAALHFVGERDIAADAVSRFGMRAGARDPYPVRQLSERFGKMA